MSELSEVRELLKELCVIPAPSGREDLRVEFCLRWLAQNGVQAYEDTAKNVIVPVGDIDRGGLCVFLAHTDIVFPDESTLPYEERDGKIFSPGVGDNTVHVAMLMRAAKHIKDEGICPKNGALIVFNSCEEGLGNLKGVKQIMKDFAGKVARVIAFDGRYDTIVNRPVGSERYRIKLKTEGGHSFSAFGSKNAIAMVSELICELYNKRVPEIPGARTTYNVGTVCGGTSVNTIAQNAETTYEFRSDSIEGLVHMRSFFESVIERRKAAGDDIEVEMIGVRPCASGVDAEELSALVERCDAVYRAVRGKSCKLRSGSTDINIPMSQGIPAVTLGGYDGGGAHTREEWLETESIATGYELVRRIVKTFIEG